MRKKELEDAFYKVTEEPIQKMKKPSQPESETFTREDITTEEIKTHELNKSATEFISRDQILNKINDYLNDEPLKIGNNDYYFIRIVGKHLEIGRTKISLER